MAKIFVVKKTKGYCIKGHHYFYGQGVCLDLTLRFGKGNEPKSAEEFEKMIPQSYIPYDMGSKKDDN